MRGWKERRKMGAWYDGRSRVCCRRRDGEQLGKGVTARSGGVWGVWEGGAGIFGTKNGETWYEKPTTGQDASGASVVWRRQAKEKRVRETGGGVFASETNHHCAWKWNPGALLLLGKVLGTRAHFSVSYSSWKWPRDAARCPLAHIPNFKSAAGLALGMVVLGTWWNFGRLFRQAVSITWRITFFRVHIMVSKWITQNYDVSRLRFSENF